MEDGIVVFGDVKSWHRERMASSSERIAGARGIDDRGRASDTMKIGPERVVIVSLSTALGV